MEFITLFFMFASFVVLGYIIYTFRYERKVPMILEMFFLGVYACIFVVFLYPEILNIIQEVLGIQSALNFIVYCSIFVLFFLCYNLYQKDELQREEITKLVREIAFLRSGEKKRVKKKK